MEIDYSLDIPIYEQVVQQIRQMIASGELRPGDTLPPVRQLASQLDVAANTIARAYQELANQLGDPNCIRAAATANGKNPIAIAIPCHRVIAKTGKIHQYRWGAARKKAILPAKSQPNWCCLNADSGLFLFFRERRICAHFSAQH